MANATKDRKTTYWPATLVQPKLGPYGLPAAGTVLKGVMQTLDTSARPKNPGAVAEIVVGVSMDLRDNSAGANDAVKGDFQTGPFKFALHGTNPPTNADVGQIGYASDNQTISRLASDGSQAGIIMLVESDGVWVWIGAVGVNPTLNPGLIPVKDTITAFAGGGQANATQLIAYVNRVTTVGTAADSLKLPVGTPGMSLVVRNTTATSANVFGQTGAAINEGGANAAFPLAAGKSATFYCVSATQWIAVLTA
jgi:hypothetical protein